MVSLITECFKVSYSYRARVLIRCYYYIFPLILVTDNPERQLLQLRKKWNKSKSRSKWVRQRSHCCVYGQAYIQIMVSDNEDAPNKHLLSLRWRNWWSLKYLLFTIVCSINFVTANRPPQFLTGAQTEIVLRLKEGLDTPVGEYLYRVYCIPAKRIAVPMGIYGILLYFRSLSSIK